MTTNQLPTSTTSTRFNEIVNKVARYLSENDSRDVALAASILSYQPEIVQFELDTLCNLLAGEQWGCHRNDVIGVLEMLQKHMEAEPAK